MAPNDWTVLDPAIVSGQLSDHNVPQSNGPMPHGVNGPMHGSRSDSPPHWIKANLEQLTADTNISTNQLKCKMQRQPMCLHILCNSQHGQAHWKEKSTPNLAFRPLPPTLPPAHTQSHVHTQHTLSHTTTHSLTHTKPTHTHNRTQQQHTHTHETQRTHAHTQPHTHNQNARTHTRLSYHSATNV